MQVDYAPFVDRMIQHYEGPYGWNKKDPGGPTKYGITCYDLAEHMGQKMDIMERWAPIVQAMTLATAEQIYATKYATAIGFNTLPAGCDVVIMDYAVNSGTGRGETIANEFKALLTDPVKYIDAVCDERLRFMHAIKGGAMWAQFGHGWGTRVADLRAYSIHAAAGTVPGTAPDLSKVVTPKATNVGKSAVVPTAGTAVPTGVGLHLSGFHWGYVIAGVAVVAVGGVLYEAYHEIKANQANALVHV